MIGRSLVRAGVIAAMMCSLGAPAFAQGQAPAADATIVTRGEGRITRAPEVAWIKINTIGRGEKTDQARKISADAMTAVQAALQKLGVPESAMRTLSYTLQPDYEYVNNRQQFRGFVANNLIQVRLDDVGKVAAVIDAAGAVNMASITETRFDVKDPKAASKEALRVAVEDAMASARAIASGAGRRVAEIVKLQEDGVSFPDPFRLQMASAYERTETVTVSAAPPVPAPAPPSTPIIPGEITVVGRVVLMIAIR